MIVAVSQVEPSLPQCMREQLSREAFGTTNHRSHSRHAIQMSQAFMKSREWLELSFEDLKQKFEYARPLLVRVRHT